MFIYPWGDFHSLNLGWFLVQFKAWTEKIQEYLDNGGGTSENLANVIAPVFNAENSYLTGDYVLYNNELYKANQAVNPGTWNPEAWTRCLVTEEIESGGGSAGVDNVARLMIAGQYSNTYNYRKYAICRYNDKLWMCNTNLPAGGEEWEPSHWDEITVGAGLTGLRISVETLSNAITAINEAIGDETEARQEADTELQNAIDALSSDNIDNDSTDVSGTTVTDALDNLKASLLSEITERQNAINSTDRATALPVTGDTNNTGNVITANTYIILKGNSTLSDGGYISITDIATEQTLTNSNLLYIPNGLINYLKYDRVTANSNTTLLSVIQNKYGTGGQVWAILLFYSTGNLFSDFPSDANGYGAGFVVMAGYYHTAYYQSTAGDFYIGIKSYSATSWTWTKIH